MLSLLAIAKSWSKANHFGQETIYISNTCISILMCILWPIELYMLLYIQFIHYIHVEFIQRRAVCITCWFFLSFSAKNKRSNNHKSQRIPSHCIVTPIPSLWLFFLSWLNRCRIHQSSIYTCPTIQTTNKTNKQSQISVQIPSQTNNN